MRHFKSTEGATLLSGMFLYPEGPDSDFKWNRCQEFSAPLRGQRRRAKSLQKQQTILADFQVTVQAFHVTALT